MKVITTLLIMAGALLVLALIKSAVAIIFSKRGETKERAEEFVLTFTIILIVAVITGAFYIAFKMIYDLLP